MDRIFDQVRRRAEEALEVVNKEIQRREAELQHLVAEAQRWSEALRLGSPPRKARSSRRAGGKRGSKRVNWDNVLASLPNTFTVDDVMKDPGARARGKAQVYPTFTRWIEAKKVKRVAEGKYEKLAGAPDQASAPAATGKKSSRGTRKRATSAKRGRPAGKKAGAKKRRTATKGRRAGASTASGKKATKAKG